MDIGKHRCIAASSRQTHQGRSRSCHSGYRLISHLNFFSDVCRPQLLKIFMAVAVISNLMA